MKTDTQLQHDILAHLEWEPSADATQVGVTVKDGIATLTGAVSSFAEKMTAEKLTKEVYGVRGVANDLEVHIPGKSQRNDTEIATAAANALQWDVAVPDDKITVTVRKGWVTLEGTVDWQFQVKAAIEAVKNLIGVRGVTNAIKVKARVRSDDVKSKIEAAFKRSAELDARRVGVDAHDGKITLRGNVRTWSEHDQAIKAVWSAPGVTEVEDRLTVVP